jgi:hypothetical protein
MKRPLIAAVAMVPAGGAFTARRAHRPATDHTTLSIIDNIELTTVEVAFRVPGRVICSTLPRQIS